MRAFSRPANLKTTQNRHNRPKGGFFQTFFFLKSMLNINLAKYLANILALLLIYYLALLYYTHRNKTTKETKMEAKSPLQILNAELNTCKPAAPREKVMVAGGWFIKETAEQTKKDLKEFKAFVKEKFRQQASDLVVYFGHSRQKAEAAALETARNP